MSRPDVTIPASTRGIFLLSSRRTFTGAILTVQTPLCEQCSAILRKRGNTFLFPGLSPDTTRGVPHLAGLAVARLCAAATARRSGFLLAACGRSLSLQGHRTRSGAQPPVAYRVR